MDDYIGGDYKSPTEEQKNAKKWMKLIAVLLVLLFIICIALVVFMYYIKSEQLKITVDGKSAQSLEKTLIFENGKVYVPIRTFANYVGYESANGGYKQYSEDTTQCYVQNNYEVATFSLGSNKIYKMLLDGSNDYEYYEITEPIKTINNQLCISVEGAKIAFNISMEYNNQENRVTIFTLPYLVEYYTAQFQDVGVVNSENYSNQKVLLYNMVILKNNEGKYGVYDLSKKEILGMKYASIKFVESTKEFIVTTEERKMGIMLADSTTKIRPEYDNIKQIDKDSGLYLVTNNRKHGVINGYGSTIVFIEYDQIGIDPTKFSSNNIQNQYLLYNNCIPVRMNNKWRLFDKTGKRITQVEYDDLGCTVGAVGDASGGQSTNAVLLIAEYEGIVIKQNNFYGIIDSSGETMLPTVLTSVYSTTSAGQTTYSMIHNNQVFNVSEYIRTYIRPTNKPNNNQNNNQNNNEVNSNEQNNNVVNNNQVNNEQNNNQANNNAVNSNQLNNEQNSNGVNGSLQQENGVNNNAGQNTTQTNANVQNNNQVSSNITTNVQNTNNTQV